MNRIRMRLCVEVLLSITVGLIASMFDNYLLQSVCLLYANIVIIYRYYQFSGEKIDLFVVFMVFFVLYSLSGPVSLNVFGEFSRNFTAPFFQKNYLLLISILSLVLFLLVIATTEYSGFGLKKIWFTNTEIYLTMFLSFIFELINIQRIDGFKQLLIGKSQYQSLITESSATLPSLDMFIFGLIMILFTVFITENRITRPNFIVLVILSLPIIISNVVIGARGPMIRIFLTVFVVLSLGGKFKLNFKILMKLTCLASVFMVMFTYNGRNSLPIAIQEKDISIYLDSVLNEENLKEAFNLGKNEFGFTYGNYNEFYKKYGNSHDKENTILEGIENAIPRAILKKTRKKQIVYRFRDEFFPERATYGRVSSTGFSALLEGHINFGYIGSIFYYSFLICVFYFAKRLLTGNKYMLLLYLSLLSGAQRIHRISFGDFLGIISVQLFILSIIYLYSKASRILSGSKK